jgi:glucose/arabinose dehydrogenase
MARHLTRSRRRIAMIAVLAALAISMVIPASASGASFSIWMKWRASGLSTLTQVTNAADGTNRLFLVERRGTVRAYENSAVRAGFFLDIRDLVEDGGERGLLSIAFHPDFETNRRLFALYTRNGGDVILARFTANAAGTSAARSTYEPLLVIEHSSQTNHNGGTLKFGPHNGYLYVSIGDGGGSNDPENNGQDRNVLLGKILRLDVDGTGAGPFNRYAIPADNPFVGGPGLDEIWSYGLRNPWRMSFDRLTNRLFIADVGQSRWEEINRELPTSAGGVNYGWRVMEGRHCRISGCSLAGDTLPFTEYSHSGGNCSITGGYVFRGPGLPSLVGHYVFADFCSGRIWTISHFGSNGQQVLRADTALRITSFGESESGHLYVTTIDGRLYQVRTR